MATGPTRRRALRRALIPLFESSLLVLGGCTYEARVPAVDGYGIAGASQRQPGQFAVLVQSDGWKMKVDVEGLACSLHNYEVDVEPSWTQAMKSALTASLGTVDFVPALVPPAAEKPRYDAQIGVVQSDASTHVSVAPGLLQEEAQAKTQLKGALTIVYPDGTFQYDTIEGSGAASSNGLTCGAASRAIGAASATALREFVQQAALATKSHLAEHRQRAPPA